MQILSCKGARGCTLHFGMYAGIGKFRNDHDRKLRTTTDAIQETYS